MKNIILSLAAFFLIGISNAAPIIDSTEYSINSWDAAARDVEIEMEDWMFDVNHLRSTCDSEEPLAIENWMLKSQTVEESPLQLESWMFSQYPQKK